MTETEELLETIINNTFTKYDLVHRLALTRDFLNFYYFSEHEKKNLTYLLNEFIDVRHENRDHFNALFTWGSRFFDRLDRDNFNGLLDKIEAEVKNLPAATIYLPFIPPPYENAKLSGWFRKNINPRFLINVKLDLSLIGGCALLYNNRYFDFSLRYYLEKSKTAVKKVVEGYLGRKEA